MNGLYVGQPVRYQGKSSIGTISLVVGHYFVVEWHCGDISRTVYSVDNFGINIIPIEEVDEWADELIIEV